MTALNLPTLSQRSFLIAPVMCKCFSATIQFYLSDSLYSSELCNWLQLVLILGKMWIIITFCCYETCLIHQRHRTYCKPIWPADREILASSDYLRKQCSVKIPLFEAKQWWMKILINWWGEKNTNYKYEYIKSTISSIPYYLGYYNQINRCPTLQIEQFRESHIFNCNNTTSSQ